MGVKSFSHARIVEKVMSTCHEWVEEGTHWSSLDVPADSRLSNGACAVLSGDPLLSKAIDYGHIVQPFRSSKHAKIFVREVFGLAYDIEFCGGPWQDVRDSAIFIDSMHMLALVVDAAAK